VLSDFESNTDDLDGPGWREAGGHGGLFPVPQVTFALPRNRNNWIHGRGKKGSAVMEDLLELDARVLTFDIADEVLERAAKAEPSAFTLAFCTSNWDSCGMVD